MEIAVIWTDSAMEDLQNIFDYYNSRISHRSALKVSDSIIDSTIDLEKNPLLGRKDEFLKKKHQDIRYIINGNYKILYLIDDNFVVILSVFDCRQNPDKLKI